MLLVASNRGPVTFEQDVAGDVVARRGGGGLVTALTGALQRSGGLWIASGMSDEDHRQAGRGHLVMEPEAAAAPPDSQPPDDRLPYRVRYLSFDPEPFDHFYNGVSNQILWFLHHQLWDVARWPRFGDDTREAWSDYRDVNGTFAAALHDEAERAGPDPVFLVQDYHLSLTPATLRQLRPSATITHFSHIPFAGPSYLSILPAEMRTELLSGLLGADVVGFQTDRWADAFLASCRDLSGARVDFRRRQVRWDGRTVRVRVYPISIDLEHLRATARSAEAEASLARLRRWKGDRRLILRVDRTDLSKNVLRGFLAYERFLVGHPEWRGRVAFLALLNPSRQDLPEYRTYLEDCVGVVERINQAFGQEGWQPIELSIEDDLFRAVAAYGLYDVLLVNPVFDGMNLVAKEGPALNRHDGVLVLSENAGSYAELGRDALGINPFDVGATAEALAHALEMEAEERARRARGLKASIRRNRLEDWVGRQVRDLERAAADRR